MQLVGMEIISYQQGGLSLMERVCVSDMSLYKPCMSSQVLWHCGMLLCFVCWCDERSGSQELWKMELIDNWQDITLYSNLSSGHVLSSKLAVAPFPFVLLKFCRSLPVSVPQPNYLMRSPYGQWLLFGIHSLTVLNTPIGQSQNSSSNSFQLLR